MKNMFKEIQQQRFLIFSNITSTQEIEILILNKNSFILSLTKRDKNALTYVKKILI